MFINLFVNHINELVKTTILWSAEQNLKQFSAELIEIDNKMVLFILSCLRAEKLSGKTVSFYTYEIIMFFSRWHIWTSHAWNRWTRNTKVHNRFSFSCSIYFITECLHRPGNFLVSTAYCVHYLNFTSLVPQSNWASHCDLVLFQSNLIVCFHFSYKNMVFKKKLQAAS
jgi:hypothetical protein